MSEPWTYCPDCGGMCAPGEACAYCRMKKEETPKERKALEEKRRIYAIVRTDEKLMSLHLYLGIDDLADAGSCVVDGRWLRGTLDGIGVLVPLTDVERIVDLGAKE